MASQMKKSGCWPPSADEGFVAIMNCRNDVDAAAALRAWALYGSSDGSASGSGPETSAATALDRGTCCTTAAAGPVAIPTGTIATLTLWQDHVARHQPSTTTGIKSFFKPKIVTPAAAVTSKGKSAGEDATATGVALGKPAGTSAGAVAQPGDGGGGGEKRTLFAAVAVAEKSARPGMDAGDMGAEVAPGLVKRPRTEPPETDEQRSAKRHPVGIVQNAVSGRATGSSSGHEAGLAKLDACGGGGGGLTSGSERVCDKEADGAGSQGSRHGGSGSGQAERNALSVLMASASRKVAVGPGGGRRGSRGESASKQRSGTATGDFVSGVVVVCACVRLHI